MKPGEIASLAGKVSISDSSSSHSRWASESASTRTSMGELSVARDDAVVMERTGLAGCFMVFSAGVSVEISIGQQRRRDNRQAPLKRANRTRFTAASGGNATIKKTCARQPRPCWTGARASSHGWRGLRKVLWEGALGGCFGRVLWEGALGGCFGKVLWEGAFGGCFRRVLSEGAFGGCVRRVRSEGAFGECVRRVRSAAC
jgi:hypothetical protein